MSASDSFDEAAHEGSSVHVVKVGGKPYAVGLIWNDVEDKAAAMSEARKVAARPKIEADLFCLRAQGDQYGLGWKRNGHAKGMGSLAGQLADARTGGQSSWIGLFHIEGEGYYLLAVRDELILGETDKLYVDEMEARAAFEDLLGISDWGDIQAPQSLGFDHVQASDLANALRGAKPPRMQDIDRVSSLVKFGGLAIVVIGIILGGMFYLQHLEEIDAAQKLADAQAAAAAMMPGNKDKKVEIPPMPWEERYRSADYLLACDAAMRRAVLTYPGWNAFKMECEGSGTNVKLSLERSASLGSGGGTINWIRATLDRSPLKASAAPLGENGAMVTWQMEAAPAKYAPVLEPKPPALARSTQYLRSWFEEAFTVILVTDVQKNQFFQSAKFKFETPYEPSRFSTILGRVPGATVDKVTVDLRRQPFLYTVEGSIHEQLPLPQGVVANNPAGTPAPAQTPRT